jgi:SAM-dependent methyltransferase
MSATTARSPYPDPAAIFAGTADDYALHRITHPAQVADYITHLARQQDPAPRMVEIGCGPGTLTLDLAARGVDLIAVDPNQDMVTTGRARAAQAGLLGIDWRVGTGESITQQEGLQAVAGAVMADSFHWMDRAAVLGQLDDLVQARGFVAVVCSRALGTPRPWWFDVITQVRARFVGMQPDHLHRGRVGGRPAHLRLFQCPGPGRAPGPIREGVDVRARSSEALRLPARLGAGSRDRRAPGVGQPWPRRCTVQPAARQASRSRALRASMTRRPEATCPTSRGSAWVNCGHSVPRITRSAPRAASKAVPA